MPEEDSPIVTLRRGWFKGTTIWGFISLLVPLVILVYLAGLTVVKKGSSMWPDLSLIGALLYILVLHLTLFTYGQILPATFNLYDDRVSYRLGVHAPAVLSLDENARVGANRRDKGKPFARDNNSGFFFLDRVNSNRRIFIDIEFGWTVEDVEALWGPLIETLRKWNCYYGDDCHLRKFIHTREEI